MAASNAPFPKNMAAEPAFGLVHAEACDPNWAGVAFFKNWWDRQGGPDYLKSVVVADRSCGKMETPLIVANWDGAAPSAIAAAMTNFFFANPDAPVWEFGKEENLGGGDGCCSLSQLALLERKLSAVRAARTQAKAWNIEIAYQIANLDLNTFRAFLNSPAAALIDVLAPHPYPWPDFPTPETWHDQWLGEVRRLIAGSPYANKKMKIMYTEVGAPVSGADAPGDRAQSPLENAQYLVKLHVMAFNAGVQRVYWYQGRDNCYDPKNAECNFGLISYDGQKRPAYFAYRTLQSCLTGKVVNPIYRALAEGARTYEFVGAKGRCVVAWTFVDGVTERTAPTGPAVKLPVAALTNRRVLAVRNTTGAILQFSNDLTLSPSPIFIETD